MIKRIVGLALLVAALAAPVVAYAATTSNQACPAGCTQCPCPFC